MSREGIIRRCKKNRQIIHSKLQDRKNYRSNKLLLRDVSRFENLEKEIEIQQSYLQHELENERKNT